jgi:AraC family transcriptional regulator, regulatory protein of adaptative response / methylated-DNA-[protein]-cysteine methyltransferase
MEFDQARTRNSLSVFEGDTLMALTSREAHLRLTARSGARTDADLLFCATGECALGKVLVARSVEGVCAILIGEERGDLEDNVSVRFPDATLISHEAGIRDDLAKVARYVDDPSKELDLDLNMRGTPVQRRVWQALRSIPVGQTRSIMYVARLINSAYPAVGARVVAKACAANPLALAVPCHRVIWPDGDLTGYRWGLMRKRELLTLEGVKQAVLSRVS